MKTFLKIVGGFFALVVAAGILVVFLSSDMQKEVDAFFNEIKAGRYQEAMTHTSKNFQSTVTVEGLKKAFPQKRFASFISTSFANREVSADGTGKLSGKVEFADGSSLAIEVRLIKENDQWKIDHISLPQTGISQSGDSKPTAPKAAAGAVPKPATIEEAVSRTMGAFAQGVKSGDFGALHALTADEFKMRYPDAKVFEGAFGKFRQQPLNWDAVGSMKPVITKTEQLEGPVVKVYGYMPTTPERLGFVLRFVTGRGAPQLLEIQAATFTEDTQK